MEIKKLRLRNDGMFSNVNEVVQHLYLAEQNDYQFIIDWGNSCYRKSHQNTDPWNYYFEDCFQRPSDNGRDFQLLPSGAIVCCTKNNIITPRLLDGNCKPLLFPNDRALPHRLIQSYIAIKPNIAKIIQKFMGSHFKAYTVGLHIRGPGRNHGGVPEIRKQYPCKNGVPFEQYFKYVDLQLDIYPEAQIFACSDSAFVLQEIMERYGKKVISYPSTRSLFGEMHILNHPANKGRKFSPYKLGEDVLVEAYLLSNVSYFVHGNSNVVNYVLCNNPILDHRYVYE